MICDVIFDIMYDIGLSFVHGSGMFSYPNFNAQNKTLNHPDIILLAMIAELSHIDLRVIILQRKALSILSSTNHRLIGIYS